MSSKSLIWFFAFCFVYNTQGICQNDEAINMAKAIEIAKENYPSIKAKTAERLASTKELSTARSSYLPDLVFQAQAVDGTSNQVRGAFFPNSGMAIPISGGIKNDGTNSNIATWSSFGTAFINWNVFNFGKITSKTDLAKAEISQSQSDYDNEVFQHQIKVCDVYIMSILLDGIVKAQQANLDRAKALKNVTDAYTKSGLKAGVDSSLVNAEYSKAYLMLLESKRLANEQKILIKEMMGVLGQGNFVLDTSFFLSKASPIIPLDNDVKKNPVLIYYQSIVDYNRAKIKNIKRNDLPSISLIGTTYARGSGIGNNLNADGSFNYNQSLSEGLSFRAYDYMFGVSTIWNLTNSYRNQLQGGKQYYITQQTEELYNEQKLKLEGEMERANLRFIASQEAARQAPLQLKAAADAYKQSEARYNSGLTTIIELTQTYAILNRAEVDFTLANANTWRALLAIAAVSGNINLFTQNIK